MDDAPESRVGRGWRLLALGFVVFLLGFELLERLLLDDPGGSGSPTTAGETAIADPWPELRRLDDGGIEIRHDFFRRTTVRLDDAEEDQALFDCLDSGFTEVREAKANGWDRTRVRRESRRVQDRCLGTVRGLRLPPAPPRDD